jgi:5-methylcytosine-specific restriction protein A
VTDGARCTAPADEVDHIVRGDDHSYANLASICLDHHKQKTAREAAEARRRTSNRRPAERHPGLV